MSDAANEQPLLAHLLELRSRLVRIAWVFVLLFFGCMYFREPLYNTLVEPLTSVLPGGKLTAFGIISPFMVQIKIAAMLALLLSLPHTLYQVWAFIAPGLYRNERRLILPLVVCSTLLFLLGMAFVYFFVLQQVFHFIVNFLPDTMQWLPDTSEYLEFVLSMFLVFGLSFQVPILVVVLTRIGLVSLATLRDMRPYVIVGAFIIAAVVTPPDVFSQTILALSLLLLFELGMFVARFTSRPAPVSPLES